MRSYTAHWNGTRAAITAGYTVKSAGTTAYELLKKPHIATAVAAILEARKEQFRVTGDKVLEETARIALGTLQALLDDDGRMLPMGEWPAHAASMVASVELGLTSGRRGRKGRTRTREDVLKVKLWDKVKALELLHRHLGLSKEDGAAATGPVTGMFVFPPGTKVAIE